MLEGTRQLRDRLAEVLPHVLAPTLTKADVVPDIHPRKEGGAAPNMLATDDAVIHAAALPDVARYLRDSLGYSMLTNVTAIDYINDNIIELVYHFVHLDGGAPATLKVRTSRDDPRLPSLTPEWPGADFQEREAFDLYGVVFEGHPDLRRIFMWDEFVGFPMRKDFPKQGDKYFSDDTTD